jgi:hypothetical protein
MREITREELAQVENAVWGTLGSRIRRFEVLCSERGLVLRGQAPTYYVKLLAQHSVMTTVSLPIEANEIEVS